MSGCVTTPEETAGPYPDKIYPGWYAGRATHIHVQCS
jgi:hypothetical protein